MPPIRDLHRLGRSLRDAARVLGRAVAAHDLDLRLLAQPRREGGSGAIRQEIDDLMLFQVGDHRPIALPPTQCEIIDPDDARWGGHGSLQATNEAAQRGCAQAEVQARDEACPCFASKSERHRADDVLGTGGASRIRTQEMW